MAKAGRPKGGRPRWTPDDLKKVEHLASLGLTKEHIARCLGISYDTLNKTSKKNSQFNAAIKDGEAKGVALVASHLIENVKLRNTTAQIFYLKCRGKWREQDVLDEDKRRESEEKTRQRLADAIEKQNDKDT